MVVAAVFAVSAAAAGAQVGIATGEPVGTGPGRAAAAVLLAAAVLCWPASPRRWPTGRPRRGRSTVLRGSSYRVLFALAGAVTVAAAAALAGVAGLLTVLMLVATGTLLGRRLLVERRRRRALPDVLRGLRTLNRELRAGADPLSAAAGARRACRGAGEQVLGRLVVLMQSGSGGDPDDGAAEPEDRVLDVLRSGWLLSRRHGVAFGRVVSGIADELSDEIAAEQARSAQLAGPRLSGYVMAGLPLMGLLLGAGMGANPAKVLLDSAAGHLLLTIGVALMCAGLLWSARIAGR